jgi:hypothetical protein
MIMCGHNAVRHIPVARACRVGLLCTGLALLVAGCGGSAGAPAIAVRPVLSASQLRLPVQKYEPSFQQEVAADQVVTKLTDQCVRSFNLQPPAGQLGHVEPPAADVTLSAVQWLDTTTAREYGFNPPPDAGMEQYDSLNSSPALSSENPGVHEVLFGVGAAGHGRLAEYAGRPVPKGGCLGEATSAVSAHIGLAAASGLPHPTTSGDPGAAYFWLVWPGLPRRLEEQAVQNAQADPRMAAVTAKWHACMARLGFHYQTPLDAMSDSRWAPGTANASSLTNNRKDEIAAATADAKCQASVDFAGVRLALLTSYEKRLFAARARQLRAYEHTFAQLMKNVTTLDRVNAKTRS